MSKENLSLSPVCRAESGGKFIPNVAVNCLILGFDAGYLKLLLYRNKETQEWIIPGSYIAESEDVGDAVLRVLHHRTGLKDSYIKQFFFFDKKEKTNANGNSGNELLYSSRFISLCYYALVKHDKTKVNCECHEEIEWFDINNLPVIHPSHEEIIDKALFTLRQQIGFLPLGYELLPEKFTMPELRNIYEAVLGREIDRRNFQRKMLSIGYIKPLNETRKMGAHKSPNLYSFDKKKYKEAEENGLQIMSNNL